METPIWYSLTDSERADLLEYIEYTLTQGDDYLIHLSNIRSDFTDEEVELVSRYLLKAVEVSGAGYCLGDGY